MQSEFLRELDRWALAVVRDKITESDRGVVTHIGASDLARMLADYVLLRVAEQPSSCWTACELDAVSDGEILAATTFNEELLAAGFIGAVCELSSWQGPEGIDFMVKEGVPSEDAEEIAAAVEVVAGKLGARGQELVQRLASAPRPAPVAQAMAG